MVIMSFHAGSIHLFQQALKGTCATHLLQDMGRQNAAHLSHIHLHVMWIHVAAHLGHALHQALLLACPNYELPQPFVLLCTPPAKPQQHCAVTAVILQVWIHQDGRGTGQSTARTIAKID